MGPPQRKIKHKGDKPLKAKYKTKRKTKDLDQINDDMKSENKMLKQPLDMDLTGGGQHYCLHCAKYFISQNAMKSHFKTKPHKRRLKALETEPYTTEEAERAAGMGSYIPPKKRKVHTQQLPEKDME